VAGLGWYPCSRLQNNKYTVCVAFCWTIINIYPVELSGVCMYMCVCVCVCVYIYIYTHTHTHTHTHTQASFHDTKVAEIYKSHRGQKTEEKKEIIGLRLTENQA